MWRIAELIQYLNYTSGIHRSVQFSGNLYHLTIFLQNDIFGCVSNQDYKRTKET